MNGKKTACVVLIIAIAIMIYIAQIFQQKTNSKRLSAESAEQEALTAQREREIAEISVQATEGKTNELRRFLTEWKTPAERIQTQTEVEETIQASLRMNGLVVLSQKFEQKAGEANKVMPKFVKASIVIQDDYAKTMNWVGDLERRLPLCRINSCQVTGAEEARQVQTDLSVEVPIVNLSSGSTAAVTPKKH
jgi:hypothetical protein